VKCNWSTASSRWVTALGPNPPYGEFSPPIKGKRHWDAALPDGVVHRWGLR
jgi:hypothetical protein